MPDDVGPLAIGAVQHLSDHRVPPSCGMSSPDREGSRSTDLKHLRCVVRECYNPSGSAVVTCLHAAARPRRAARAVQGAVVSVWQALQGTPRAPRMTGLGITPLLIKPLCPDNARVAGVSGRVAPCPFPALVGHHDTRDIMWLGTHTGRRAFHKQT